MNDDVVSRIKEIMDCYALNSHSLSKELGYKSSEKISRLFREGNAKPSYDILYDISNKFEINTDWLITGRGSMEKDEGNILSAYTSGNNEGIPLIPISAMAGAFSGEIQVLKQECEHYYIPSFKGADFLITVKGSSMVPTYDSGDLVACKVLSSKNLFFQWNKVYVIDTDQGALIKRIKPGEDKKHLTLISDNPDYPPFQLSIEEIYHVALVVGVIRME